MRTEELGRVREEEVFEAIRMDEVIEEYGDDKPYPSVLVCGRAQNERPLHVVCAYSGEDDLAIVVTAYQPDPNLWMDYKGRSGRK